MVKIKIIENSLISVIIERNREAQYKVFENFKFNLPNDIALVFHNGINYDYY